MSRNLLFETRMIAWFSCGAASAAAAKIAVEEYSKQFHVEVCYCDMLADEHPDNERFLSQVEEWIGVPVKRLHHPKYNTIHEVFLGERFLIGPNGAPCTRILKQEVRLLNSGPDDVHVLGFSADEAQRQTDFETRHRDMDCEGVLQLNGVDKAECMRLVQRAGIELPTMYKLGFSHNNCVGCIKGGMGHWNKVRRLFPERFDMMARTEREIGFARFRDKDGPVWLDELDPERGRPDDEPPPCGFLCEMPRGEEFEQNCALLTGGPVNQRRTVNDEHGRRH